MENSNQFWEVLDANHHWIYANKSVNRLVSLPDSYDYIGKHVTEPPARAYECASDFIVNEELCMNRNRTVTTLDIHPSEDGSWFCYLFDLEPLRNNDLAVGTIIHGNPVIEQWQGSMKALLAMQSYYTGQKQASMQVETVKELTQRQAEILFFLLCRIEPKRIARYLNLNPNTINTVIDRMRLKFDCNNTPQLIEKVVCMDWHKLIPERLIGDKQVSMIMD